MSNPPTIPISEPTVVVPEPAVEKPRVAEALSPNTTIQQDLTTAGQRKVNLIWETTQAIIAVLIVLAVVIAALFNVFNRIVGEVPTILSTMAGMIIGFYYARTNHQAIGGIGRKANELQDYLGR